MAQECMASCTCLRTRTQAPLRSCAARHVREASGTHVHSPCQQPDLKALCIDTGALRNQPRQGACRAIRAGIGWV